DPLFTAADGSAEAELEWRKQIAEHSGFGAKHDSDTQPNDAYPKLLGFSRSTFAGFADAVPEAALAAVKLGHRFVAPCAVPSHSPDTDHHGGPTLQARDQTPAIARHA